MSYIKHVTKKQAQVSLDPQLLSRHQKLKQTHGIAPLSTLLNTLLGQYLAQYPDEALLERITALEEQLATLKRSSDGSES